MLSLTTVIHDNSPEIQQIRLLDRVKSFAKRNGLSDQAIKQKTTWILKFSHFHNKHHPVDLNHADIESFLSSLATEKNLSQSVQMSALSALEYLYQQVLQIPLKPMNFIKNKARRGFIDHFGGFACQAVTRNMQGNSQLMAELASLGRLKLREVVNLKLSDVNIKRNTITVRKISGEINFVLNIPVKLILNVRIQVMRTRQLLRLKTKTFSNITSINRLSGTTKSAYLFPNTDKTILKKASPLVSSQTTQLALLKNDINIAIRHYLTHSSIRFPRSLNNVSIYSQPQFEKRPISLFSNSFSQQSTFDFNLTKHVVSRADRMHELKQSVA